MIFLFVILSMEQENGRSSEYDAETRMETVEEVEDDEEWYAGLMEIVFGMPPIPRSTYVDEVLNTLNSSNVSDDDEFWPMPELSEEDEKILYIYYAIRKIARVVYNAIRAKRTPITCDCCHHVLHIDESFIGCRAFDSVPIVDILLSIYYHWYPDQDPGPMLAFNDDYQFRKTVCRTMCLEYLTPNICQGCHINSYVDDETIHQRTINRVYRSILLESVNH